MKKVFLLIFFTIATFICYDAIAQSWSFTCAGGNCLKAGVEAAGNTIGKSSGIITSKSLSRAVQDIIIYFLTFLSLIAVIYVMWAGAQMLLFPASEDSSEKTKKIIVSVIIGVTIIWFAWWIVSTLFFFLNNKQVTTYRWIPRAIAETQIRNVDFTTYSNNIRALKTRIIGGYSPEITSELNMLIDGAYDHLPNRADKYVNKQLYDRVKKAIADYDLRREEIDRGILENAIDAFLERVETFSIQGTVSATPRDGDSPLSVTLEGKNIIDSSGTIIPDANFTWWVRTAEGPRVLGRGKTINYIFKDEGTFTVYLTVNSASRNSRNFVDVISFEDQTTIEVGQAKLKLLVYFNDQLASDSIKIPTRESTQKILIDASQTKFASGYTISKTEWDFGNGKTIVREGTPIVEAQSYKEGEYTIKITLTRNDGESFTRNILLKVGDPIASISVSTKTTNKGDNVIFQAKKVTQEGVTYSWEIRKFGVEQPINTATGPRMEFTFREVGRYNVGLTSTKGDARDKQTVEVNIESRPPVVRFNADKVSSETPNIYVFDGTSTYDPDYPDDQGLKYQWYVNDKPVQLSDTNTNNSRGEYTFGEIGVYQVELRVVDGEGKNASFKKTITIKSLLSIQINIRPQVVKRGDKILLLATAPNATIYEWAIGSKDIAVTQVGRYISSIDVSGTYPLTLKVTDKDGNTNSLQRKIYVTDGNSPFSVVQMSTKSIFTEIQPDACDGKEALIADRVTPVSLVGDKSVNVGGKTTDLTYFWKVGLNASSTQKNFNHTFDELGCEKISLTVTDKKTGTAHTSEEWIKVVNIPPRFSDIEVKIENVDQDPMRINLQMQGAKDPDGVIRSYTWYYYTSTDEQPQGFRITTKPETSFSLPKINGRYFFSVVLEDANGLRVDTRDISENKFSTPDLLVNQNISTPIIEFTASTKDAKYGDPVELKVIAKNALGQDITKAVEYRWDVDGDGFYDIKTSENVLSYKYTVPGEYHPKVKATHRGLSTTKFLTITVTNRLIPQAQIQVIGDKIIAYNTSTGIIQGVSWYADNTKVSENKDYLIYTPQSGAFPKTIRLEITDGQDIQSATIPVERNLQNKVLVRKAGRPLVILTNENSSVTTATDDITWSDPTKPLFFYLGESEGEIQYYVIDNDIDIDTDLSGGKNDDADNKGTASYRLGRPYGVPVGTKRVSIMRFRLLGTDGKEIDSRQIRVTRSYIAQTIDKNDIIGVTPDKTSQTFNLSKEDKTRLDRLSTLVKSISDESAKNDIMRYVDQLGDIWYDRADRAETLLQLSRSVDTNSAITPDLKSRILEQVNLIYTQGQQDAEEKDLAKTIISDFLSKNPGKKDIFGDGTPENPGLIGQIIDNPEYYEQNKKIVDRIYNEYVKFDEALSEDAKIIIQEKLLLLAGNPPVEKQTTGDPVINEKNNTTGFLSKIQEKLKNTGNIFIWIVVAIIGLFGIIFTWSKLTSSKHIDTESGPPTDDATSESTEPSLSTIDDEHHDDHTPDWLKNNESPFGSEDVLSKEVSESTDTTHTPEWMHDHPEKVVESTTIHTDDEHHDDHTPDWLKETTTTDEYASLENTSSDTTETTADVFTPTNTTNESPSGETPEIPDWLKGAESPVEESGTKEEIPENEDKTEKGEPSITTNLQDDSTTKEKDNSVEPVEHEIPDWLKGTESLVEEKIETTISTEESAESPLQPAILEEKISPPLEEVAQENQTNIPEMIQTIEETPLDKIPETITGEDSTKAMIEPATPVNTPPMPKTKTTKKKREGIKHWKKEKNTEKSPALSPENKLLEEGNHLIGPATDLLDTPKHLIVPEDNTPLT